VHASIVGRISPKGVIRHNGARITRTAPGASWPRAAVRTRPPRGRTGSAP
jgi:hypothetical protein